MAVESLEMLVRDDSAGKTKKTRHRGCSSLKNQSLRRLANNPLEECDAGSFLDSHAIRRVQNSPCTFDKARRRNVKPLQTY